MYTVNSSEVLKLKSKIKAEKEYFTDFRRTFTRDQKRLNEINREKAASN